MSVIDQRGALSGFVTFEEFLERHQEAHVEWVDGNVVPMAKGQRIW
jgi:hypothetical protein